MLQWLQTGFRSVLILVVLAWSSSAYAFEESGHNMVAQLMLPFLQVGAREELKRLYGDDWQREVVSRASQVQSDMNRPKFQYLKAKQQTLFELGDSEFNASKHCPDGQCSVAAILESQQVLMRSNFADVDKRMALNYLLHYMVQLHVPINCGLARDQGGEKIYLKDPDLQPVNLAWIWNYDLYRKLGERWFTLAQKLYRDTEKIDTAAWVVTMAPQDWALETHQIAIEQAYPLAVEGRYSAEMVNAGQKVLQEQLIKAAFRSAALLNQMFDDGTGVEN